MRYDLLLLTETFDTAGLELANFICYNQLAQKRGRGRPIAGLTIAINKKLDEICDVLFKSKESLGLRLRKSDMNVIVSYFPPDTRIDEILFKLTNALSYFDLGKPTIIGGDFNCRIDNSQPRGCELIDEMIELGFTCLNEPDVLTYICHNGASTIDFMFHNSSAIVGPLSVLPSHFTKHNLVTSEISIKNSKYSSRAGSIRSVDLTQLEEKIAQIDYVGDVNRYYESFVEACKSAAILRKPRKSPPWFDKTLYNLHNQLKFSYKNKQTNLLEYNSSKRIFKRLCRQKKATHIQNREFEIIELAQSDKSKFWGILKASSSKKSQSSVSMSDWESHFDELYNVQVSSSIEINDYVNLSQHNYADDDPPNCDFINRAISTAEIVRVLSKTSGRKATGPDGISNELLKSSFGVSYLFLTTLFQTCFRYSTLPDVWKTSYILPLYKGKGPKDSPSNYRGISLLSCCYKIYSGIIHDRIYQWAEGNSILPRNQYGFRKGLSTIHAINELKCNIQSGIETYAQYYVCFVDFKKAFDTVDRNTLIQKLIRLGLHGEIIHALGEICSKNFQQVADGCNLSNKIPQLIGVTQGDKLSPLLFSLFIADLPDFIDSNQCLIILYADDLIIASPFLLDVKRSLNDLHEYCRINKLTVNVQKTSMMKFRKGGPLKKSDKVFYGYEEIGFTNSFCYLGYNLSPSLTITTHLKHLVRSAIRSTFALQQKLPFSKINFTSAKRLFESIVYLAAMYGIQTIDHGVFSAQIDSHVKQIQGIFWKKWCGLSVYTRNTSLLHHILGDDFLRIDRASPLKRRIIAQYYANEAHHLICLVERCFESQLDCICRYCNNNIDFRHLDTCHGFTECSNTVEKLLKATRQA